MSSFILTRKACEDLKSIAIFTQNKWGKNRRKIYIRQIDDSFHMLAETPNAGIACDEIRTNYRKFPISSHIIFYREIASKKIEIVRILHKKMDVDTNLA